MEPPAADSPSDSPSSAHARETPCAVVLELSNLVHACQMFPRDQAPKIPSEHEQAQKGDDGHVQDMPIAVLFDKGRQGQELVNVDTVVGTVHFCMGSKPSTFGHALDVMANAKGSTVFLLMNLHVRVREPDGKSPTNPDDPCSVDDGDPFEFGEAKKVPGKGEDMKGGIGQIDEVCEGDELKGRGCVEEHEDPVENQAYMADKREGCICRMAILQDRKEAQSISYASAAGKQQQRAREP